MTTSTESAAVPDSGAARSTECELGRVIARHCARLEQFEHALRQTGQAPELLVAFASFHRERIAELTARHERLTVDGSKERR